MSWVPLTLMLGTTAWWLVARFIEDGGGYDRGYYSDYAKLALLVSLIVAFMWTVAEDVTS